MEKRLFFFVFDANRSGINTCNSKNSKNIATINGTTKNSQSRNSKSITSYHSFFILFLLSFNSSIASRHKASVTPADQRLILAEVALVDRQLNNLLFSLSIDDDRNVNDKEDGFLISLIDSDELSLISTQVRTCTSHQLSFSCLT